MSQISKDMQRIINDMVKEKVSLPSTEEEEEMDTWEDLSLDLTGEDYHKEMVTRMNLLHHRCSRTLKESKMIKNIVIRFQDELHATVDKLSDLVDVSVEKDMNDVRQENHKLDMENKILKNSLYQICDIVTANLTVSDK